MITASVSPGVPNAGFVSALSIVTRHATPHAGHFTFLPAQSSSARILNQQLRQKNLIMPAFLSTPTPGPGASGTPRDLAGATNPPYRLIGLARPRMKSIAFDVVQICDSHSPLGYGKISAVT